MGSLGKSAPLRNHGNLLGGEIVTLGFTLSSQFFCRSQEKSLTYSHPEGIIPLIVQSRPCATVGHFASGGQTMLDWRTYSPWGFLLEKVLRSPARPESRKGRRGRQARFETLECRAAPGSLMLDLAILGGVLGSSSISHEDSALSSWDNARRTTTADSFTSIRDISRAILQDSSSLGQRSETSPNAHQQNSHSQQQDSNRLLPPSDRSPYDSVFASLLRIDLSHVLDSVVPNESQQAAPRSLPTPAPNSRPSLGTGPSSNNGGGGNGGGGGGGTSQVPRLAATASSVALPPSQPLAEGEPSATTESTIVTFASSEAVAPVTVFAAATSSETGNGAMDGSDFLQWQRNFGSTIAAPLAGSGEQLAAATTGGELPGDFNSDGSVDGADLGVWEASFAQASSATTTSLDGLRDHEVTVTYEDSVFSTTSSTNLTFSITSPDDTQVAGHEVLLEAFRGSTLVGNTTILDGSSTSSVAFPVSLQSGNNTIELKFTRVDNSQEVDFTPTIQINRNQLPEPGTTTVSLFEGQSSTAFIGVDGDTGDTVTAKITEIPDFINLFQNGNPVSVGDELSGNPVQVVVQSRSIANDVAGTLMFTLRDDFENIDVQKSVNINITDIKPPATSTPILLDGNSTDGDNISRGDDNGNLRFSVQDIDSGAEAVLLRGNSPTGPFMEVSSFTAPASGESSVDLDDKPPIDGTYFYTARQKDTTGSVSELSVITSEVFYDTTAPTATPALSAATNFTQELGLPVIKAENLNGDLFDILVTEQQFLSATTTAINHVSVEVELLLNRANGVTTEFASVSKSIAFLPSSVATIDPTQSVSFMAAELGAGEPGQYQAIIRVTDAAGNPLTNADDDFAKFDFYVDAGPAAATLDAPNTPVYSELFFIGARFMGGTGATIVVDQPIPAGLGSQVHIDGTSYDVASQNDLPNGTFELTLATTDDVASTLIEDDPNTLENEASKIAWLKPWQMSFDKTTQTVWFNTEDGERLGQFDPATGNVNLYDVSLPDTDGNPTAFNPHGVFFDFNTHLTPRIWLVHRNSDSGGGTTRVSYFDLARKELFTYEFSNEGLTGGHAVFVDALGDVWITARDSDMLIQLDFDGSSGGLGSTEGKLRVHRLPDEMADRGGQGQSFRIHGVQVVVDQRTGQQYVYAVDAGDKDDRNNNSGDMDAGTTGRLALLIPGSLVDPAVPGSVDREDTWFVWNFDPGLDFENDGVLDNVYRDAHVLFTAIDDNETPGIPEDDFVILGDPGPKFVQSDSAGDGIIRKIDVGSFVGQLLDSNDLPTILPETSFSEVLSVQIPSLPGAQGLRAAPIQMFVDREGTLFASDPQGGVIRLNIDAFEDSAIDPESLPQNGTQLGTDVPTKFMAQINRFSRALDGETMIDMGDGIPLQPTQLTATRDLSVTPGFTQDRSVTEGVDQYIVAAETEREQNKSGGGQGPFRGALNATNVLYGSLAQSDYLSATIFAETARRQVSVVASPNTALVLRGRMAFQVLSDGSLVMTGRRDSWILDDQVNVSKLITAQGNETFGSIAIDGDVTAIVDGSGTVHVFGKNSDGELVRYEYTGSWGVPNAMLNPTNWSVDFFDAPVDAEGLLVGDPVTLVDSAGEVSVLITTSGGQLLRYEVGSAAPINLTQNPAHRVYSSVAIVEHDGKVFAYGTNQMGGLVEYSYDTQTLNNLDSQLVVITEDRPAGQVERDTMVFQDVEAVVDANGNKDIYATDGNSRLVHYRIDGANPNVVYAENVSKIVADTFRDEEAGNEQAFGQFPFQEPFVGRVYSGLEVLVNEEGKQFIYGTDGGNLILFIRGNGAPDDWRVANLTNDVYAIHGPDRGGTGQAPENPVPGNAVFGSPSGYVNGNNDRHVFQINAEGEVVEYYILINEDIPRFHTQNMNLRTGCTPSELLHENFVPGCNPNQDS